MEFFPNEKVVNFLPDWGEQISPECPVWYSWDSLELLDYCFLAFLKYQGTTF